MAIYATEASIFLALLCIPAMLCLYFFFYKENTKVALGLLVFTGFLLSLFMAAIDPFLHPWDERFHALVAKNMMEAPFQPMLFVDPVLPYQQGDWTGEHIWLHKQPLFLWQMALSMKLFGVHEITMRLPAVLMTSLSILLIYDLAKHWTKNISVAFIAAFLFTFCNYQLELLAGRYMLDQNDIAFAFYMTACIWAFVRYTASVKPLKWVLAIGVFAGAAILNKWLTGLLIFGGWGLYLLIEKDWRFQPLRWGHLVGAFAVCVFVFMPWQWYISVVFPVESSIAYAHNALHIHEVVEGHKGSAWFHLEMMWRMYGLFGLLSMLLGFYFLYQHKEIRHKISIALLAMLVVIYVFFSLIVATKMPSFTYPVNAIFWVIASLGLYLSLKNVLPEKRNKIWMPIAVFVIAITILKPWHIADHRSENNRERVVQINNTKKVKSLDLANDFPSKVIINCKTFQNIDVMFYQDATAYHWFPKEEELDSLTNLGIEFAAFESFGNQYLPDYITSNESVEVIPVRME